MAKLESLKPKNFHEERVIFENLAILKLLLSLNFAEFKEAKILIKQTEEGLKKFKLNRKVKASLLGNFAVYNFVVGEFQNCIKWIDEIIENKNVVIRKDVQRYVRVLKILCFYSLDDIEKYELACRSAHRYIQTTSNNKDEIFEYDIISRLKKIGYSTPNEIKEELKKFREHIIENKNNPSNKSLLGLDEYYYWVESIIANSTIMDLIKNDRHPMQ